MALVDRSPSVSPLPSPDVEWDSFLAGWSPNPTFPPTEQPPSFDISYFTPSTIQANYPQQLESLSYNFSENFVEQVQEWANNNQVQTFDSLQFPNTTAIAPLINFPMDDFVLPAQLIADNTGQQLPSRVQYILKPINAATSSTQTEINQNSVCKDSYPEDIESITSLSPPDSYHFSSASSPSNLAISTGSSPNSVARKPQSTSGKKKKKRKNMAEETVLCTKNWKNGSGESVASVNQWRLWNCATRRKTEAQLKRYRLNREVGPCEKCLKSKKGCDRSYFPYIDCLRQKSLVFLHRPESAKLFRDRPCNGHPLASERQCIYKLGDISIDSERSLSLKLSQGIGKPLKVWVNEFEAHSDFKTKHVWQSRAGTSELEMPRLCLASLTETRAAVEGYIRSSWHQYLEEIVRTSSGTVRNVLYEAQRYSMVNKNSIVHRGLMLLAVNRMIERDWTISDTNIEMSQFIVNDEYSSWYGKIPITPVMDTQLDQIIIQDFLVPLRRRLLYDVQTKMDQKRKEDWFEIFLAVFILATNTELLLRHSRRNAIRYGARRRYNSVELAEEYFHGTNILLAHFHYGCNGTAALMQLSSKSIPKNITGLQDHQKEFLHKLRREVQAQKNQMLLIRSTHQYETEMFWSHQLFFQDWKPDDRNVVDEM